MPMATLRLVPRREANATHAWEFYDFVVDGQSLLEQATGGTSVLGCHIGNDERCDFLLLRRHDVQLEAGQVALYVCSECGDYGCGLTVATVERRGDRIVWSDFADLDWNHRVRRPVAGLGPFGFDAVEYEAAIDAVR